MKTVSILMAFLVAVAFLQSASAQDQLPTPGQKFELLFLPILVLGSLTISLAIYKSKRKPTPK